MTSALRKTPVQPRAHVTIEQIIEAAAQVIEERGLLGYNTNAVAARAGVSIGSLYQYFPGKDAIMLALARRETKALRSDIYDARLDAGSREALIRLIDAAVRHQLRRPTLARVIDLEEERLARDADETVAHALREAFDGALRRPGMRRLAETALAVDDLIAIVTGMIDAAAMRGERDAPALARRVRAAAFGYLDRAQTA
ncbi:MAG: Transcriptional regulator [Sphingomonas bacterium]|uniref:TetR/AcrR family transcriptional regulator n=1 Tax=Sphingomonas bacterium TaxID=1895847 RepID=UPI00262976CA|nr:TetR/AcrR family transcriptional regulator [Sphingomonas bacterium]MDB5709042.1 Transcriptional regulator [Sphingomonas bacterium]